MPADPQSGAPIELTGLIKEFGSERALDGVTLAVPPRGITVLLGPSGAGKTVTIKHILGLMRPSAGVVRVEGRDLAAISEEELYEIRRGMSAMFQGSLPFSCGLFDSLSVYENVAFGLRQRTSWSPERIDQVTMAQLEMVGLRECADEMPGQVSAGMRKRTALARALVLEARIVIIDDLGFAPLDDVGSQLLFRFVAAAYEHRSLGVASHWPFESWGRFLPEHTTAVALLDRLLHHSVTVVTSGDSYRMKEARLRGGGLLSEA